MSGRHRTQHMAQRGNLHPQTSSKVKGGWNNLHTSARISHAGRMIGIILGAKSKEIVREYNEIINYNRIKTLYKQEDE